MKNSKDNPVPFFNDYKFIALCVDGYYPDFPIDYIIFDTEEECVEHIKNNIFIEDKKRYKGSTCNIVNDDNICYETNKKLSYPDYRVKKLNYNKKIDVNSNANTDSLLDGVETDKEQPKLYKAYSFRVATALDEEIDRLKELCQKHGERFFYISQGIFIENFDGRNTLYEWWTTRDRIDKINEMLKKG